jgi:hypothetical protein
MNMIWLDIQFHNFTFELSAKGPNTELNFRANCSGEHAEAIFWSPYYEIACKNVPCVLLVPVVGTTEFWGTMGCPTGKAVEL